MKTRIKSVLLFVIAMIAISSCTMEKRHYQAGYYIDWGKNASNQPTAQKHIKNQKAESIASVQLIASSKEELAVKESKSDLSASNSTSFVPAKAVSLNTSAKKTEVAAPNKISKYKAYKALKKAVKEHKSGDSDIPEIILILLCIFLPPIAVGIMTDWEFEPVAINILLCLLCWLPGIVHAFILYDRGR